MDYRGIGRVIKELRQAQRWKQTELAHGICTQGQLSKIEKGEYIPSSATLYELSQRLGFSLDDIFRRVMVEREDYLEQMLCALRRFQQEEEYEQMLALVAAERRNPLFRSKRGQQILLWHEGISSYHSGGSLQESLSLLHRALELEPACRRLSMRAVEIWLDIGVLYLEDGKKLEALRTLEKCRAELEQFVSCQNSALRIRVFYNLSLICSRLRRNWQAAEYALQGLRLCEEGHTLYLLGELYFQRGISLLSASRDLLEAQTMLQKSHLVFTLLEKPAAAQEVGMLLQKTFVKSENICK